MYCPKCSQQQISEEVRFCSRCGFQLGIVSELLETDGVLQNYSPHSSQENPSLYRQIVSSIGAKLIFFAVALAPVAILLDKEILLLIPFFLFFIGFMQIIYKLVFDVKPALPTSKSAETKNLSSNNQPLNLPAPDTKPIPILEIRKRDTSEMTPPPSVTDHTTKRLEKTEEAPNPKI